MGTKTINLYSLQELKEVNVHAYNKAFENIKERLVNNNFEFLTETLEEELKLRNLTGFELNYSVSYSQGDGVCFFNRNQGIINGEKLEKYALDPRPEEKEKLNPFERVAYCLLSDEELKELITLLKEGSYITIEKVNYRYSHAGTCRMCFNDCCELFNSWAKLEKELYKTYLSICGELEKIAYNCYEVTDEEVLNESDYLTNECNIYFNETGNEETL